MKKLILSLILVCSVLFMIACDLETTDDKNDINDNIDVINASDSVDNANDAADNANDAAGNDEKQENTTEPQSEESVSYEVTQNNMKLYTNSIGTVWMYGIVEVTNTGNTDLYMSSGKFDIEDANGSLVASKSMVSVYPDLIAPGEKAYYIESTTMDDLDVSATYTIVPKVSAEKSKLDLIRYPVTDVTLKNDTFSGIKAIGRIENNTDKEESMVYVVVILYDENDNVIGHLFDIITDDVAPGEKTGFEASSLSLPDDVTVEAVSRYEVYAYPYQLQF